MIDYEFIEKRFDQLNEDDWRQGEHMVDGLLCSNERQFQKVNPCNEEIDDICRELWNELDSVVNEDIPF